MVLTEHRFDQVTVPGIYRRVDSVTSSELETAVVAMIQRGERKLVLDFAGVDYIGSAGLRVLLIGAKEMQKCQGSLPLASLQPGVRNVLAVTGFLNLFRLFGTKDDAIGELSAIR